MRWSKTHLVVGLTSLGCKRCLLLRVRSHSAPSLPGLGNHCILRWSLPILCNEQHWFCPPIPPPLAEHGKNHVVTWHGSGQNLPWLLALQISSTWQEERQRRKIPPGQWGRDGSMDNYLAACADTAHWNSLEINKRQDPATVSLSWRQGHVNGRSQVKGCDQKMEVPITCLAALNRWQSLSMRLSHCRSLWMKVNRYLSRK